MHATELSTQDREWLAKHAEACRLKCDFILSDVLGPDARSTVRLAKEVPLWFQGDYVPARTVFERIEASVPFSQIFEQWEYRVYTAVLNACDFLSRLDARVLLVASGYSGQSVDDLYSAAGEAVEEARIALYGADEEHC